MKRAFVILSAVALAMAMSGTARAADEEPAGKKLFIDNKCNSCHTIESQGVEKRSSADAEKAKEGKDAEAKEETTAKKKRKVPDLGGVGIERKADWITKYLQKTETIDGKKHMKKFRGTDEELATLAGWLESLKDEAAGKAMMEKEKAEGGDAKADDAKTDETKTEGDSK